MNDRNNVLVTKRTLLRPFAASDTDDLLELFHDPGVRRYLLDDELVSRQWVEDEIRVSDARFSRSGTGLWSIGLTGASSTIGFVGFREFFDPPQLQLLYGLLPDYWGRGLATEAAARICEHAFGDLGLSAIAAATDIPNRASVAVLQRLGMQPVRTSDDRAFGTAFFVLRRDDWRASGGKEGGR